MKTGSMNILYFKYLESIMSPVTIDGLIIIIITFKTCNVHISTLLGFKEQLKKKKKNRQQN